MSSWNNRVTWIAGTLLPCLVSWTLFKLRIKSNRYDADFSFNTLWKWQSFLNQRHDFRDSNPNSLYSFSDDVLLIAPVTARQALRWRDPSFSWKEKL